MEVAGETLEEARQREPDEIGNSIVEYFLQFLEEFEVTEEVEGREVGVKIYVEQTKQMHKNDITTMYVDFGHLKKYFDKLADAIEQEYYRFEPFLRSAVQSLVNTHEPGFLQVGDRAKLKDCYISFFNVDNVLNLREVGTQFVGQLVSLTGTVTRASSVHPELLMASFKCPICGATVKNVEQQFKYSEPTICPNNECNNKRGWELDVEGSTFVDFQRIRVQENANEIPSGSMPRSMDVILRHEVVEKAKPGDKCVFTGSVLAIPDVTQLKSVGEKLSIMRGRGTGSGGQANRGINEGVSGLKALGIRSMNYKLSFLAVSAESASQHFGTVNIREESAENVSEQFTEDERNMILSMSEDPLLYQKLSKSLAPTIFGHIDIKRGILLMLLGGLPKTTAEGIKLRGDINVCLVGDPSTAKSQFLKYVTSFLPRSIYASGKASTAAGLTAAVVRDEDTGEFMIEAGALMLADNGVCCIDEFDKMDIKDQVSIHEAMEQQTISISKAGVHAILNARTSILAAANPIYGRYDTSQNVRHNVNLTPPIMSRFDLFFVILDRQDQTVDFNIARHIVAIHQKKDQAITPDYTTEQLQLYIKLARTVNPVITPEAAKLMSEKYVEMRNHDVQQGGRTSYRITVRQLESLIRLSEAISRMYLDEEIKTKYVEEAARLLSTSIVSLEAQDIVMYQPDESRRKRRKTGEGEGEGEEEEGEEAEEIQEEEEEMEEGEGVRVPFGKYQEIAFKAVHYMRVEVGDEEAVPQADVVDWLLQQTDLAGEDEVEAEHKLIDLVIDRLIDPDGILLDVGEKEGVRYLKVHPNYVVPFHSY